MKNENLLGGFLATFTSCFIFFQLVSAGETENRPATEAEWREAERLEAGTDEGNQHLVEVSIIDEATKNGWRDSINQFSVEISSPLGTDFGEFWVETGIKYGVHPYFLVSVAFADTTLGKGLTTSYNIGNVGNTDSCPTCKSYSGWEQGIDAIGWTLTNVYLGEKKMICEFSRGGSCHWGRYYYASSTTNWNRNASWAFARLAGLPYSDQYSVRLNDWYNV